MTQAKCKKYDLSGNVVEEVTVAFEGDEKANAQSIKDYIVALRRNARQWSASTKSRNESNHSGAKPHAQKGTGKARQGFLGAPQYRGGGRVHTPRPKFDQHVRINQKERRAAVRHLLIEKLNEGNVVFLSDQFDKYFKEPKTKVLSSFIKALGFTDQSVVCLGGDATSKVSVLNFKKSIRNIRKASYMLAQNLNGYDVMVGQKFVVIDSAKDEFQKLLRGNDAKN